MAGSGLRFLTEISKTKTPGQKTVCFCFASPRGIEPLSRAPQARILSVELRGQVKMARGCAERSFGERAKMKTSFPFRSKPRKRELKQPHGLNAVPA